MSPPTAVPKRHWERALKRGLLLPPAELPSRSLDLDTVPTCRPFGLFPSSKMAGRGDQRPAVRWALSDRGTAPPPMCACAVPSVPRPRPPHAALLTMLLTDTGAQQGWEAGTCTLGRMVAEIRFQPLSTSQGNRDTLLTGPVGGSAGFRIHPNVVLKGLPHGFGRDVAQSLF